MANEIRADAVHQERVARAREAAAVVSRLADETEAARRLPAEAVAALVSAGVFKLLVPARLGGHEVPASTLLEVLEVIAAGDGAAGWCAMIGATSGLMSTRLDDVTARAVYGADDAITSGVFAPTGRAVREGDGYRVSGRWAFSSGCEHSAYRMGGTLVEGAAPLPSGGPDVRCVLFRADETRVIDTWRTSGLCGTGSHDVEARDVLVPASRTFSFFTDAPRETGPLGRLPFFGILAAAIGAVSLGIARHAIESVIALAKVKQPLGSKRGIAHRELVQIQIAQAEAKVRSARVFLHQAAGAFGAGEPTLETRALLRLAASHAATESAAAVDLAYNAGGGSSIYAKSPLQRCFRDVHVATQHLMVSPTSTMLAGRILLDLASDTSTL